MFSNYNYFLSIIIMDSDIKKIKRRKWRIQNKTDQPIEVVADNFNFLDYQDLTKIKIRISSFRANNYGLPTFIPKYLKNLYEIGYFNNKLNAIMTYKCQYVSL